MAKLRDYSKVSVRAFLDALGAPTALPGGGSASALVAATACALLEMVVGINARRRLPTGQAGMADGGWRID